MLRVLYFSGWAATDTSDASVAGGAPEADGARMPAGVPSSAVVVNVLFSGTRTAGSLKPVIMAVRRAPTSPPGVPIVFIVASYQKVSRPVAVLKALGET